MPYFRAVRRIDRHPEIGTVEAGATFTADESKWVTWAVKVGVIKQEPAPQSETFTPVDEEED